MSVVKKILLGLAVILVIIQFIHPPKNESAGPQPNDAFNKYPASENVKKAIHTSCYDCHSNNTVYPWYSKIQPVDWWLSNHIKEGKHELNFNEFLAYDKNELAHVIREIIGEVKGDKMPLPSYTLVHRDAILSPEDKQGILAWAEGIKKQENLPDEQPRNPRPE